MKPPCMMVVQYILPALRVEIAKELSSDYNLKNAEIARKMEVTPAAVTQYLNRTRGGDAADLIQDSKKVMGIVSEVAKDIVEADNLFTQVLRKGGRATLLNGYPPGYFDSINRRHRLYSVIPLAVVAAGLQLQTTEDMQAGRAFSADFTGKGWAAQHDFPPIPIYAKGEAGKLLALTSQGFDLSWFDFWLTDVAGHRQDMTQAVRMLEAVDEVLDGLLGTWPTDRDLVILVSDHGNLEDLSRRGHTLNPVPCLVIGPQNLRREFVRELTDLTGFSPAVLRILFDEPPLA